MTDAQRLECAMVLFALHTAASLRSKDSRRQAERFGRQWGSRLHTVSRVVTQVDEALQAATTATPGFR